MNIHGHTVYSLPEDILYDILDISDIKTVASVKTASKILYNAVHIPRSVLLSGITIDCVRCLLSTKWSKSASVSMHIAYTKSLKLCVVLTQKSVLITVSKGASEVFHHFTAQDSTDEELVTRLESFLMDAIPDKATRVHFVLDGIPQMHALRADIKRKYMNVPLLVLDFQ